LAGSLRAALSVVEQTLSPPMEISELGLAPASSQAGVPDDIELRSTRTPRQRHRRSRLPTQVRTTTTAPRRTKAGGRTSLQFRRSKTQGRTRRRAKPSTWWSRAGAMTTLAERQLTQARTTSGALDPTGSPELSVGCPCPPGWSLRGPRVRSSRPAWPPGSSRAQPRCWMRTTMTSPFDSSPAAVKMSSVVAVCASPSAKAAISIPIASTWDAM